MTALLIARFPGDPNQLRGAYNRAHEVLMSQPGPHSGELIHYCALGDDALYLVGVWTSEAHVTTRFADPAFLDVLRAAGFPSPSEAELRVLELHAMESRPMPALVSLDP